MNGAERPGHALLYSISEGELILVKQYLEEHLNKDFIVTSSTSFASLILFARKPNRELRLCVDYRKLNAVIKKESIPAISHQWIDDSTVRSEVPHQNRYSTRLQSNQNDHRGRWGSDHISHQVRFFINIKYYFSNSSTSQSRFRTSSMTLLWSAW